MGVLLKQNVVAVQNNILKLYNRLANIAFWSAEDRAAAAPTALDWQVPKKTLTITNNISHSVITRNGEAVNGSILVDAGETVDLLVEGAPGYDVTSVTASGASVIDNGDGSFTVRVKVDNDMTLTISGTVVVVVVGINYNLTNCSRTSGPSSIQEGGTATIQLQADAMFSMPATLPSGAVTGASVTSYTVDANDNTKATLVIGSVTGNVTIAVNAEPVILFEKAKMYIVNVSPEVFAFRTSKTNDKDVNRACLTVLREGLANPCAWYNANSGQNTDAEAMALYSAIPIPSGTTKISIKCNASYYYYSGVFTAEGRRQNNNPGWVLGSTKTEYDLVNTYPNATHFAVTFKIGSAGNTAFTDETYESMGIELTFE